MALHDDIGIQHWHRRQRRSTVDRVADAGDRAVRAPVDSAPPADGTAINEMDWQQLEKLIAQPSLCCSCAQVSPILGEGNIEADWFFIIDAPSQQDLDSGKLLSGRGGHLFGNILAVLGLQRADVYLASVCKCVRDENASQLPACETIIHRQINLIQPQVVFALGEIAARSVLRANEPLDVLRGQPQSCIATKLPIIPSFGIPDILREPILKAELWQDLKKALSHFPD